MTELKRIRTEKRMSQVDLSIESGIAQAVISQYELGHRRPTPVNAEKLAYVLGCKRSDILSKVDKNIKELTEIVKGLTDSQLSDVNDFVTFLKWKRKQKIKL